MRRTVAGVEQTAASLVGIRGGHEAYARERAVASCAGQLQRGAGRGRHVASARQETSGVMVVAKTDEAPLALPTIRCAPVEEDLPASIAAMERERGEIGRRLRGTPRIAAHGGAGRRRREARTATACWKRLRSATWCRRGGTPGGPHQIRFTSNSLAIAVGDETYGARMNRRLEELEHFRAERQMLHARHLTFTHPRTAERLTLDAPWPKDFEDALAALR